MGPMEHDDTEELKVTDGVYQVAGGDITDGADAAAFLLTLAQPVLIDTGAGRSIKELVENIRAVGVDPAAVKDVVLTHNHIDHIGGVPYLKERYGCRIIMHELDAAALRSGDENATAAAMYGVSFPPTPVDVTFSEQEYQLAVGSDTLVLVHTPGHTPGSISPYIDLGHHRVLFAQDVHGPFMAAFNSDIHQWRRSMERLIELAPDILCEGHFGIYEPKDRAVAYIQGYLDRYARY
jgi:glyoxylase-like metal-dependent hydrolase (beta-lactamase superfamily II)